MFENAQELHRTPFLPTRCPLAYNWTTKWTTGRFLSRGGRAKNQKVSNFPGNLARPPRLERGTLCLEGRCSIQLSYGRLAMTLAQSPPRASSLSGLSGLLTSQSEPGTATPRQRKPQAWDSPWKPPACRTNPWSQTLCKLQTGQAAGLHLYTPAATVKGRAALAAGASTFAAAGMGKSGIGLVQAGVVAAAAAGETVAGTALSNGGISGRFTSPNTRISRTEGQRSSQRPSAISSKRPNRRQDCRGASPQNSKLIFFMKGRVHFS